MSARRQGFEARNLPYLNRVYNSAFLLVQDPQKATELAVGTYATVYRTWDAHRDDASLLKDLCRAMIGIYYKGLSERSRSPEKEFSGGAGNEPPGREAPPVGPVKEASGITLDEIRRALRNLPEDIRPTAVIHYLAKFSYSEVAEIVGRQQELTRSMICRSRKLLQESLLGGAGGGACLGT